jgi:hypothetical protein
LKIVGIPDESFLLSVTASLYPSAAMSLAACWSAVTGTRENDDFKMARKASRDAAPSPSPTHEEMSLSSLLTQLITQNGVDIKGCKSIA